MIILNHIEHIDMSKQYLTIDQVSERMHIEPGTARNRLSRGYPMPPSCKVGRRRLFPEDEFDKWLYGYLTSHDDVSLLQDCLK